MQKIMRNSYAIAVWFDRNGYPSKRRRECVRETIAYSNKITYVKSQTSLLQTSSGLSILLENFQWHCVRFACECVWLKREKSLSVAQYARTQVQFIHRERAKEKQIHSPQLFSIANKLCIYFRRKYLFIRMCHRKNR